MTNRYGPQTVQVEAILERVRKLTEKEAEALDAAWGADATRAWVAARSAARAAARAAARNNSPARSWGSPKDAIVALAVRDLIGQHGFTQEHFDTLVGPWESVMGTKWTREET